AITFSKHSLQQIKLRKITKNEVLKVLNNPDEILRDKFGNKVAQKIIGNFLLRVFYLEEKDKITIITAYRTSKLKKYLKNK
ncbi:MAG: DUF4258 domain-containing protein, partial [Candidatus Helarchaeota archaeon]